MPNSVTSANNPNGSLGFASSSIGANGTLAQQPQPTLPAKRAGTSAGYQLSQPVRWFADGIRGTVPLILDKRQDVNGTPTADCPVTVTETKIIGVTPG